MAKRNPNDRNEIAVQKAKLKAQDLDHHTLPDGTVLDLKDIDALLLSAAMNTVEVPELPTYDVTLASGRVVQYPMDKEVAEQSPELQPVWDTYVYDQALAANTQMRIMTNTIMLDGVKRPPDWIDAVWERKLKLMGARLPADPDERWLLYLRSKMNLTQILELTAKVMRRTGVPEEYISAAENSFPDQVPNRPGEAGDVEEPVADPGGVAGA